MKTFMIPLACVTTLLASTWLVGTSPVRGEETAPAVASRVTWEYRALRISDRQPSGRRDSELGARKSGSQDALDQLGAEGWELVAVRNAEAGGDPVFYFKRPKG